MPKPIHAMTPANADSWIGTAYVLIQQQFGRVPTKDELVTLANASAAGADQDGLRAIMATWPQTPAVEATPTPTMSHSQLDTRGIDFICDGDFWLFAGYTMHTLPTAVKKQNADVPALLREAKSYGANTIVAIGMHRSDWKKANGFDLDPFEAGWQDVLARMFDLAAAEDLRVALGVLADAQGYDTNQQQRILDMASEVMRGRWNAIARKGNESNVNGWDPARLHFPDLGGVLTSHGSQGEDNPNNVNRPYRPFLRFGEYEGRRDLPKALIDAGGGMRELQAGFAGWEHVPVPLIHVEPAMFHDTSPDMYGDRRWTSVSDAVALGVNTSANCAGGAFGASDGMVCRSLQPAAAEMARGYFRGMWGGFKR